MSEDKHRLYDRIDGVIRKAVTYCSYAAGVALVGIMLTAFINVLGEKIFHHGIPMSTEIITYLHIPVVFLAAAYVTLDRGHTKIDLLSAKFPPALQRFFVTLGHVLGTVICGFISYRGFVQMLNFISIHKKSSTSGIGFELWPFALILSFGFALLAVSFLWSIVKTYVKDNHDKKAGAD